MALSFAVAGRFDAELLGEVARAVVAREEETTFAGWGLVYCYGNRLEVIRSPELRFERLAEVRTDMALVSLTREGEPGPDQPLSRREPDRSWGFSFAGSLSRPADLQTGNRIPDGPSTAERFLIHLLHGYDEDAPVESVLRAQDGLPAGDDSSFMMLGTELLLVNERRPEGESSPQLWFGRARLLRLVAPFPVPSLRDTTWEPVDVRSAFAISRFRRTTG